MSETKMVVVWGDDSGRRVVPVDESFYGEDRVAAADAARPLLNRLRGEGLTPRDVLVLENEDAMLDLIASDREIVEGGQDESGEKLEFVLLRA